MSKVVEWGVRELASYLQSKGVTQSALESIRGNGITGEIFLELCEEDIKDAFSVFKDRFTIRKILRELKSNLQAAVVPQLTTQTPQSAGNRLGYERNGRPQQTQIVNLVNTLPKQIISPPKQPDYVVQRFDTNATTTSRQYQPQNTYSQKPLPHEIPHPQKRKWPHDHLKQEPYETTNFTDQTMQKNTGHTSHSPHKDIKVFQRLTASSSASNPPQLMHETVSSSQDVRIKVSESSNIPLNHSPYPVALTRVTNNMKEIRSMMPSSVPADRIPAVSSYQRNSLNSNLESKTLSVQSCATEKYTGTQSSQLLFEGSKDETYSNDSNSTFMLSLVTSSISRFSAEELLAKKGIRGRPTEAQRLGTVLIRNAAQSIKIWDSPPLMKDISDVNKEAFMKYIVSSAPQLNSHTDLVLTRLREALQNRRKYLMDKETGRRCLKGSLKTETDREIHRIATQIIEQHNVKTEPNTTVDYSSSLIDLTD